MTAVGASFSPPLRGGVAATSIKYREASFFLVVIDHHPVCAAEDAAQLFS
jgi:hypothetical protein